MSSYLLYNPLYNKRLLQNIIDFSPGFS